jgi:hypothetical protein
MAKTYTRKIATSQEYQKEIGKKGTIKIESDIPVDRYDCECRQEIALRKRDEKKRRIDCPRRLEPELKQYKVFCKNCDAQVGTIHASNKYLDDWANLHYYCEAKKDANGFHEWVGCMAVNISPIDQKLGFECSCGQDTRDFRANTTIPPAILNNLIEENMKGRDFGKVNSKFYLK